MVHLAYGRRPGECASNLQTTCLTSSAVDSRLWLRGFHVFDHDPEYLGLLRCVREEPHNRDRRLVLADWLEANGAFEHAMIIRETIELRELVGPRGRPRAHVVGSPEYNRMQRITNRLDSLLHYKTHNRSDILGDLDGRPQAAENSQCFGWIINTVARRETIIAELIDGLVGRIETDALVFEAYAQILFDHHPITAVILRDVRMARDAGGAHHIELPLGCTRLALGLRRVLKWPGGFNSHVLAQAMLNEACVAYGRSLADLPPLPGLLDE